jgi:ComF family protein
VLARLLSVLSPPLCWSCAAPARAEQPLCGRCRLALRWLPGDATDLGGVVAWCPVAYDGPARALVHALKFRGAEGVADAMAAQIAARAPAEQLAGATLVPVPLHPARLGERGYNQAERLAKALAARCQLPLHDCLERRGHGGRQMGRGRGDRLEALRGAVSLRAGAVAPRRALLVDDVVTTGATLAACAAALRAGGAERVCAVAYARTPGR